MSKQFLTQHLNQVITHRKNSAEKKQAEKNALLATTPPDSRQIENPSLKEKLDHIVVQEQLVLKEKQAVTIRENEVYRLEQEAATKKRIAQDQLQKEKELVEQQAIALRIGQEHLAKEKLALTEEQERVARNEEVFREKQQNIARTQEAFELEREQLVRMQRIQQEERELITQERREQEEKRAAINIPLPIQEIVELEPGEEDYYFVPLAGEDNN
jgi:hypothetical protein